MPFSFSVYKPVHFVKQHFEGHDLVFKILNKSKISCLCFMDFIIKTVECKLQGITATKLKNGEISIVINADYPLGTIRLLHKIMFKTQAVMQRLLKKPIDGKYWPFIVLTIWHTVLQIGTISKLLYLSNIWQNMQYLGICKKYSLTLDSLQRVEQISEWNTIF